MQWLVVFFGSCSRESWCKVFETDNAKPQTCNLEPNSKTFQRRQAGFNIHVVWGLRFSAQGLGQRAPSHEPL